jgi:hypothetical protein
MASNPAHRPRPCTHCETFAASAFREQGIIVQILPEWLPCAVCDEPTCQEHGKEYRTGFEHEECHESIERGIGVI